MSNPTSFEGIRRSLDGAAISTYIISMVILPVKFWCRLQNGKRNLGLDDALILVAAVMSNAFFYDTMIGTYRPFRRGRALEQADRNLQAYGRTWENVRIRWILRQSSGSWSSSSRLNCCM